MDILYLVKHFPCLSQTFVLNEVAALTSRGCAVHVVSAIDLDEPVGLDPAIRSRVVYLRHGSLYRYGRGEDAPAAVVRQEERRRKAASALEPGGSSVPVEQRRRLWELLGDQEADPAQRDRWFLDALDVISLVHHQAISHLHCDFAEENVKLAYLVHQVTGIPFTFKMRAYDIFAEPQRDLAMWAAAASRVFTISHYNKDYICRTWSIPADKVVVIYDGVSMEQVPPIGRYLHRPFRIVSVSRLVEKKGFPVLLDACRLLKGHLLKDRVPFRCDIFGDGPMMASLQDRVAELGLNEGPGRGPEGPEGRGGPDGTVMLHGSRSHAEVLAALESASAFVLPCIQARSGDRDGTPNSILEAMARGVPVVSTRLSGIPELIEDGVDGFLVPPNDPRALAEAIARIAGDAGLAESIRLAARRKVTARFTIGRTVDEFLHWIQRPAA